MAIKDLFFEGKTIDQALDNAAESLGIDKDNLLYTVEETPSKGIFGIGATAAKIKVSIEDNTPSPKKTPPAIPLAPEKITKKAPHPTPKPDMPKPAAPKSAPNVQNIPATQDVVSDLKKTPVDDELSALGVKFISGVVERLGITDYSVTASICPDGIYFFDVSGNKMGVLIGRRGETLNAVQYLTGLAANKDANKKAKIIVDTEGYRAKRVQSLTTLAQRTATKVIKNRRNVTLEPMSAYERRIIHATLGEHNDISTFSVGTEPHRKVVVSYGRKKR